MMSDLTPGVNPSIDDASVIAAVRDAADDAARSAGRIGAPGSPIREAYATRAALLYAAAARLESLIVAANGGER